MTLFVLTVVLSLTAQGVHAKSVEGSLTSALEADSDCRLSDGKATCNNAIDLLQRQAFAHDASKSVKAPDESSYEPRWILGETGQDCYTVCDNHGHGCSQPQFSNEVDKYVLTDDGDIEFWSMIETITGTICDTKLKSYGAMGPYMNKTGQEIECVIPHDEHEGNFCGTSNPIAERVCWCIGKEEAVQQEAEAPKGTCEVFGDPHIVGFDKGESKLISLFGPTTTYLEPGDFWLVKSEYVHIQGRYMNTYKSKGSLLMYLAVGGPFLNGHRLVIGPQIRGGVEWYTGDKSVSIPSDTIPYFYTFGELISVNVTDVPRISSQNMTVLPANTDETEPGVVVALPMNVQLIVNRFPRALSLRISMPKFNSVDGQCGNFNGDPKDDTAELIMERMGGWTIHQDDLAFDKPLSYYQNSWNIHDWEKR